MNHHHEEQPYILHTELEELERDIQALREKKEQGDALKLLYEERNFIKELIHYITK